MLPNEKARRILHESADPNVSTPHSNSQGNRNVFSPLGPKMLAATAPKRLQRMQGDRIHEKARSKKREVRVERFRKHQVVRELSVDTGLTTNLIGACRCQSMSPPSAKKDRSDTL